MRQRAPCTICRCAAISGASTAPLHALTPGRVLQVVLAGFLCTGPASEARRHVAIFANVVLAAVGLYNVFSGAYLLVNAAAFVVLHAAACADVAQDPDDAGLRARRRAGPIRRRC